MATVLASRVCRSGRAAWGLATLVLLGSVLSTVAGLSPVVLLSCVVALLSAALSRPFGWVLGAAVASLTLVAAFMALGQLYLRIGIPFVAGNTLVLSLTGASSLAVMAKGVRPRPLSGEARWLAFGAAITPAVCTASLIVVRMASSSPKLAWMMNNDSAFNLFTSQHILRDGGVDPEKHPSPAAGISEMVALFTGPGRDGIASADLLEHDLVRAMQLLVLATSALSFVGAIGVVLAARGGPLVTRFCVAVAVAVLPWTWIMFGQATQFGFWNAIVSSAVLATAWLAFAEADRHPTAASAAQALAGTALLALWAPLLLAPALFGLILVLRHWRAHMGLRRWALGAWLAPVALLAWYFVFVVRPLFTSQGAALGADGAMFPMAKTTVQAILITSAAIGLLAYSGRGRTGEMLGAAAVLIAGIAGLEYLIAQREGAPSGPWGYYPAKFGWLIAYLAILVGARAAAAIAMPSPTEPTPGAPDRRPGSGRSAAAAIAPIATTVAMLIQVPPADPRPLTAAHPVSLPTPVWSPGAILPVLSIAQEHGSSELDPAVATLLKISSPEEKHVLSRFHADPALDAFVNFWLLSQPVVEDNDAVRYYAYFLEPDNPDSFCDLATTWGPGLEVWTKDVQWGRQLERRCQDADWSVVSVHPAS
ncbi:hypothetical protein [Nocardioides sp. Soil774]|uniref:hypothetical protein n=1 Tax=Nocardioides sp. Soil774 TaxID=1736408 RepID=UPI0012FB5B07|nr:hypothetical protein [Nocardioides sp. Soil774]